MKKKHPKWAKDLADLMDSPHREVRERVRALIKSEPFQNPNRGTIAQYRQSIWEQLQLVADAGIGKIGIDEKYGGEGDQNAFLAAFETMAEGDISLTIKFGVQFGLFGGSIQNLGTKQHHEEYLRAAMEAKLPGCFAMTEGDHGSNVAGLETTITYNKANDTYIVNTPHEGAGKDYIGNAALHARMASVFGQLYNEGKGYGVHCILVPIRDEEGNTMPGVRIEDDGHKMGLNGVDNGRLWFKNVEVPRENLLNRFGGVNEDGDYTSEILSESRRFFTMLGTLVGGRVSIGTGALTAGKRALKLAINHALERRQFGENGRQETLLMDYKTHQLRLIPDLAKTFALHFALRELANQYNQFDSVAESRIFERDAAALKAAATWHATHTIQSCREACGGAGYLSKMGFTDLKGDTDIFATFEGDNTVLQLLVARELLKDYGNKIKNGGPITAAVDLSMGQLKRYQLSAVMLCRPEISIATIRDLLVQREQIILMKAGKRIGKRIKKDGVTATAAFNEEGPLLIDLTRAHTDLLVYDHFKNAASDPNHSTKLRKRLQAILALYGLGILEENNAWFLSHGLIPLSVSLSLKDMILNRAGALRKHIEGLAFALLPAN